MQVKDHKKFCCFDYESDSTNKAFQLGDVVTKITEENDIPVEIGVVIQLHEDGDIRTDEFGNASPSEVELSSMDEIKTYRPKLIEDLDTKVFRVTYRMEYYFDAIDENDARVQFQSISREDLDRNSAFVELVSIDEED